MLDGHRGRIELSVVIPVFQERKAIHDLILYSIEVLDNLGMSYEIIAVDDGSNDGTAEALCDLRKNKLCEHLQVVLHPYNKGLGSALKTGISASSGEIIAWMDGDGQHDPHELSRMLPYIKEYDLVVGSRTSGYKAPWYRNVANKFFNWFASWLAEFKIDDLTSGYRLFRASIIKKYLHLLPARFSSATTSTLVLIKGGYNIKYVSIDMAERQGGRSKIRIFRDGWRFLVIIIKIVVLFEPLKVFTPIAFLSFVIATLDSIHSMLLRNRLIIPNSAVIFYVLSVLVFLLGLISEQIAVLQISPKGVVESTPIETK